MRLSSGEETPRQAPPADRGALDSSPAAPSPVDVKIKGNTAFFTSGAAKPLQISGTNIPIQVSAGELDWAWKLPGTIEEIPLTHDQVVRHSSAPAASVGQSSATGPTSAAGARSSADSAQFGGFTDLAPGSVVEIITSEDNRPVYPSGGWYWSPQFQYFSSALDFGDLAGWVTLVFTNRTPTSTAVTNSLAATDVRWPTNDVKGPFHPEAAKGGTPGGNGNGGDPPGHNTPPGLGAGRGGGHGPPTVPEPGAWSMVLLGFIILCAGRWSHSPPWK